MTRVGRKSRHGQSQPWLDSARSKSFLRNEERLLNCFDSQTSPEGKLFLAPPPITPMLQIQTVKPH